MPTLAELITKAPKRSAVVSDLVRLVDAEVARKGGLSGLGIKAAYAVVKAIKPTFVSDVVDGMLDECASKLEPLFAEGSALGAGKLGAHFTSRAGAVADALLAITDGRADRSSHGTAKKAYLKLRPTAKRNVEEAVPALATLLVKHTQ